MKTGFPVYLNLSPKCARMTLLDRLDSLFVHLHELNQDTEEVEYYEEDTAQVLCRILEFKEELLLRLLDLLEMIKTKGIKSFTERSPKRARMQL